MGLNKKVNGKSMALEAVDWSGVQRVVGVQSTQVLKQGSGFEGKLDLSLKSINDEGCRTLAPALSEMTKLKELHLYKNQIGDQGMVYLSNALPRMKALSKLYLYKNQIGDQGIASLSNVLPQMKALNLLYLTQNKIGDYGMVCLSSALPKLKKLRWLYLESNRIGNDGITSITNVVKNGIPSLNVLQLVNNTFPYDGKEAQALKKAWLGNGKGIGYDGLSPG